MAAALITAATVALVAWSAFYLLRRLLARLSRRRCPSCCQDCPHPCACFFPREKASEKEL